MADKKCYKCGEIDQTKFYKNNKAYYCKKCFLEWQKEYNKKVVKRCSKCEETDQSKFYKSKNYACKKCHNEWLIEYRKTPKGKEVRRTYDAKRDQLSCNMRSNIGKSLKGNKSGMHWEDIVNYTLKELKEHLEKQFKPGMSWDNHIPYGWHIDHIKPISSFNITSYECEDFKNCWSLNNLQPLWWRENLQKGDKITWQN